jgi:creatine kinase
MAVSTAKGGDVQQVFWSLSKAVWALETSLHTRGHKFIEDPRLGFLNASPANIGTALRASVYVKLVLLGQQPGFEALVRRLRLIPRSDYPQFDKRYTGIFDIANAEALGKPGPCSAIKQNISEKHTMISCSYLHLNFLQEKLKSN